MPTRKQRRFFGGVIVLATLAVASLIGTQLITNTLRKQVVAILGDTGHASRIDVTLRQITLDDVTIGAPAGWPTPETLRARRIVLRVSLLPLLSHRVVLDQVTLDDAYLSVVRDSNKHLSLLPSLQHPKTAGTDAQSARAASTASTASTANIAATSPTTASSAGTAPASDASSTKVAAATHSNAYAVELDHLDIHGGTLAFFDRSVDGPVHDTPYRMTLQNLQASIGPLHFPADAGTKTTLSISGNVADENSAAAKATADTPTPTASPLRLDGWIVIATQQSDITTRFNNVDIRALTPYLDKNGRIGFTGGRAGLDAHMQIDDHHQLQANGRLTLDNVKVGQSDDPGALLKALPREAIIAALQNRQGRISLDFTLSGNLSDPHFSLDETLTTRLIAGLAKVLGVSAEGVARGLGDSTRGLGGALLNLIGR